VKPRILMVVPEYPPPVTGGVERQAQALALALVRRGLSVEVLTSRRHPSHVAESRDAGVVVHRLRLPEAKWLRFPWTGVAMLFAVLRLRSRFDVLHAHSLSWFGTFAVLIARGLGRPAIGKLPTSIDRAFPGNTFRFRAFQGCDAVIAMTRESVGELEARGIPEQRIVRVTNGVDTGVFHPGAPTPDDEARELTVLFSGRLIPLKGLPELLRVWPAVVEATASPVTLSICGTGPQEPELRAQVAELGIAASVRFEGHVEDLPERLRRADVFVLPSHVEGNSNSVLEAMATGLPVVSTRVGGTPLLVGPEGARWLVEPRDAEALRERLIELLRATATRDAAGQAMLDRVNAYLSIDRIGEIYEQLYRRLHLGGEGPPAAVSSPIFEA
jgi:glycosyltransferase involved in cell wall biosynthesis